MPSYIFLYLLVEYNRLESEMMTSNDAVRERIFILLKEKNMTQYRLEQESGIQHGSMQCIMNGRNKNVTLNTLILISKGFNITLSEFLDHELFDYKNFDLYSD